MPRIKSAVKRVEVTERNRRRNVAFRSAVKTAIKKVIASVNDVKVAEEALKNAFSVIDRAVLKGILHKNAAARYKSRIAKLVKNAKAA